VSSEIDRDLTCLISRMTPDWEINDLLGVPREQLWLGCGSHSVDSLPLPAKVAAVRRLVRSLSRSMPQSCDFFLVLGFELRAYTLSHSTSPFCDRFFFKIGSLELFVWTGFEP
jgi:hypothetical protein